jgi:hypothetical protein
MGRAGVRTRRRTELHLLDQFVDLNAGCPCDAQWQCVRAFRCDGPADRRNAGDRNGGTRQELCEQVTATDFSHVFPPLLKTFSLEEAKQPGRDKAHVR